MKITSGSKKYPFKCRPIANKYGHIGLYTMERRSQILENSSNQVYQNWLYSRITGTVTPCHHVPLWVASHHHLSVESRSPLTN